MGRDFTLHLPDGTTFPYDINSSYIAADGVVITKRNATLVEMLLPETHPMFNIRAISECMIGNDINLRLWIVNMMPKCFDKLHKLFKPLEKNI